MTFGTLYYALDVIGFNIISKAIFMLQETIDESLSFVERNFGTRLAYIYFLNINYCERPYKVTIFVRKLTIYVTERGRE